VNNVLVKSRINSRFLYSGLDSPEHCRNKDWFQDYPYTVEYKYNSRGFRDSEWPDDLTNAIWCIGDSFTVGIGSPIEHTWPSLLSKETGMHTINISMDGASNDWIAHMSTIISQSISPKKIIHQWSYTHRRGVTGLIAHTPATEEEDVLNFVSSVERTQNNSVIHSMIPKFEPVDTKDKSLREYDVAKNALRKVGLTNVVYDNEQLDYARDYHHYDILTAKRYVADYINLL